MGGDNPLVKEPEYPGLLDSTGTFLFDDLITVAKDVHSGSWLSTGLVSVTTAFDAAATVSDPIGSLIAAGLGWVMDHLEPLRGWLNDLTGDAHQVEAFAGTYENIAGRMDSEAEYVRNRLEKDLTGQTAELLDAYRKQVEQVASGIQAMGAASEGTAGALKLAATIVDIVHGITRDALAQVVGTAISCAAEEIFSLGLATPLVIEQISTRMSSVIGRVSTAVRELVKSVKALEALINKLDGAVGKARSILDAFHPDAARGQHQAPWLSEPTPHTPGHEPQHGPHAPKHAAPETMSDHAGDWFVKTAHGWVQVVKTELPRDVIAEGYVGLAKYYQEHPEALPE